MDKFQFKDSHAIIAFVVFQHFVKYATSDIGVVFSPYVMEGDNSSSSKYTLDDIKTMLELIVEKKYHTVATYFLEANNEVCNATEPYYGCSSVALTSLAAAEINRAHQENVLSIYLGLKYSHEDKKKFQLELESASNIVSQAESIYPQTVKAIIFPGLIESREETLNADKHLQLFLPKVRKTLSIKSLSYGARIYRCHELLSAEKYADWFKYLDFIICQYVPENGQFPEGPRMYFEQKVIPAYKSMADYFRKCENKNISQVKVMIEAGWPGRKQPTRSNTGFEHLIEFWDLVEKSELSNNTQIFMHEAFDNPFKNEGLYPDTLGSFHGRWRHNQDKNDTSASSYIFKLPNFKKSGAIFLSKEFISLLVSGVALLFCVLLVTKMFCFRRGKRRLTEKEIREFFDGQTGKDLGWEGVPFDRRYELTKQSIEFDWTCKLGYGAFGKVYKGRINGLEGDVALKMLKSDSPISALRGILSEIKILTYLGKHDNIVGICGAYTAQLSMGVVYLATEYCPNGSLEKYLRSGKEEPTDFSDTKGYYAATPAILHKEISDADMLQWAVDIASAMEFISSKNVVHADLATRNILLTSNLVAKVTDFGLSRRLYEHTEYVKKSEEPLPWRWMAVESLKNLEFSTSSDVWSYAVTLWEIYSLGETPYAGLEWSVDFVKQLEDGLHLSRPKRAGNKLYDMMRKCWSLKPHHRPFFGDIKQELVQSYSNSSELLSRMHFEKLV